MKLNVTKSNAFSGILTALTCLSFCAAGWYYSRGSEILVQYDLSAFLHELCAFLIAGIIPSIIFEFSARMFSLRKRNYGVRSGPYNQYVRSGYDALPREALEAMLLSEGKKIAALRVFLIAGNLLCFGLSFIYFANRVLYVWGKILLNFLVSLLFFAGFLFFQTRKTEKNKIGFMIMQTSRIYLTTYCLMVLIELAFTLL